MKIVKFSSSMRLEGAMSHPHPFWRRVSSLEVVMPQRPVVPHSALNSAKPSNQAKKCTKTHGSIRALKRLKCFALLVAHSTSKNPTSISGHFLQTLNMCDKDTPDLDPCGLPNRRKKRSLEAKIQTYPRKPALNDAFQQSSKQNVHRKISGTARLSFRLTQIYFFAKKLSCFGHQQHQPLRILSNGFQCETHSGSGCKMLLHFLQQPNNTYTVYTHRSTKNTPIVIKQIVPLTQLQFDLKSYNFNPEVYTLCFNSARLIAVCFLKGRRVCIYRRHDVKIMKGHPFLYVETMEEQVFQLSFIVRSPRHSQDLTGLHSLQISTALSTQTSKSSKRC